MGLVGLLIFKDSAIKIQHLTTTKINKIIVIYNKEGWQTRNGNIEK